MFWPCIGRPDSSGQPAGTGECALASVAAPGSAAACAVGQFVIGFMLASLRSQLGRPIDQIAADDPLRLQFNQWHQYSEWTLSAGMFAALLAFFFLAGRISGARTAADTAETTSDPFNFDKPFKKT